MSFRITTFFICCILAVKAFGIDLDSLEQILSKDISDSITLNTYSDLCQNYRGVDIKKSIDFAEKGIKLARKIKDKKELQHQLNNLGVSYAYIGEFENALKVFQEAFEINESISDSSGIATGHNNLGLINYYMGNYQKAINHYLKAIEIRERHGELEEKAAALNNIGLIYEALNQVDKALKCHQKAYEIRKKENSPQVGSSLANIGNAYYLQGKDSLALKYFLEAHAEFEANDQKNDLALLNTNIALIYENKGDYEQAEKFLIQGLKMHTELEDNRGIGVTCSNLANLYCNLGEYEKAKKYALNALTSTKITKAKDTKKTIYAVLHKVYAKEGDFRKAYEYQTKLMEVKDSLLNEKSLSKIKAMEREFEVKHEDIIREADSMENKLEKISSQDQKIKLFGTIGVAFILIFFSLILYNAYQVKNESLEQVKEKNILLAEQDTQIKRQSHDLEEALNYAQKIQEAILPTEAEIKEHFNDAFVFFRPKHIVGGDFYWFSKVKNYKVLSVLDCTGHGIAGGYMAMLGNDLLSQIINDDNVRSTGQALTLMNLKLATAFSRVSGHEQQLDGMEVALMTVNEDTNELEYTGAFRHLYLVREGKLEVIKGESHMIGVQKGLRPEFHSIQVKLQKGDAIYLHTDGYANQFGGAKEKKFKYKNMQKLMEDNYDKLMSEQKEILVNAHEDWKGDGEQLDDICIIGIRI